MTNKSIHCKTSHTLKIDVFEISDNKIIGKSFLKYKLFSLLPLPFLPNFTVAN